MSNENEQTIKFIGRGLSITNISPSAHLKETLLSDEFFRDDPDLHAALRRAGYFPVCNKTIGGDCCANISIWESGSKTNREKYYVSIDANMDVEIYYTDNLFTAFKFVGEFCANAEIIFSFEDEF